MKRISILGSTGSIGQNTIDLVRRDPAAFQVVALTGGQNIDQLARDAKELKAEIAVTADDARLDDLRTALKGTKIEAAAGAEALVEAAQRPAHWVMSAIVGAAGLRPGLAHSPLIGGALERQLHAAADEEQPHDAEQAHRQLAQVAALQAHIDQVASLLVCWPDSVGRVAGGCSWVGRRAGSQARPRGACRRGGAGVNISIVQMFWTRLVT